MLMSHAASSTWLIGLPRFGPSARASPAVIAIAMTTAPPACLRVNMFDLPFAVHCPTRDAVVMLVREREDGGCCVELTAVRNELRTRRLHVAGFVPRAAL